jgi:mRNA-degrading endonuclease RelE of RelBE toxin-antitoxin system
MPLSNLATKRSWIDSGADDGGASDYPAGVESDLIKRLHSVRLTKGETRSLAAYLPSSDEELHHLIESLVASADEAGMTALMYAMAAGGRLLEARFLPGVLPLLNHLDAVSMVALRARGEVAETLLKAVEGGVMGWEREAVLLMIAGWICVNREPERTLPANLIPKARMLARDVRHLPETLMPLFTLADITGNKALQTVLEELTSPPPRTVIDTARKFLIEKPGEDPLYFLPEQMDRVIHTNGPLRRAVPKVGRNDPCPCGSGAKYKKCCFAKDQERLHHSSEIAGVTTDELEAMPEPFLTRDRLETMRGPKLTRLRIEMVPPDLQRVLLERLSVFQQTDALLAAWEKVGWREDLVRAWEFCMLRASDSGQHEVVARLVRVRGLSNEDDSIPFSARLMLLRDQPERFLHLIEETARRHLENPYDFDYIELAGALAEGHLPGLGTLVARGAAAAATPIDAEMLFESISKTRDRLNLPPEDPAEWILDRIFDLPEEIDDHTRGELDAARRQMDAASAEASRLRSQLAETRAQLERQERIAARNRTTASAPTPLAPADPPVAKLRARVDELKTALKERHAERNALRRELNDVLKETAALREARAGAERATDDDEPDREEQALLAEEPSPLQPLRLPVFPGRFSQALESFPENVGRSVMSLIGELAAGKPAAFVGMRRLRVRHEICRVRVAGHYRLLFKLQSGKLEILDLINRRDFEKWLKTIG